MIDKKIAIIPARGGSKRIPRKNIKKFLGYPIIKYSIDAAIASGCFNEIMVSTDDQEIAEIVVQYGAKVPFYRSKEASNDYAMTADVIMEALLEYQKQGRNYNYACCIYPTAPFISSDKIKQGYNLLNDHRADSVLPVVRFGYPIQRAIKIINGKLEMIWPENYNKRSQDLMPAYHDVGQFYWLKVESFYEQKTLFMKNSIALEIAESEVQDIDNEEDWKIAEMKYQLLTKIIY